MSKKIFNKLSADIFMKKFIIIAVISVFVGVFLGLIISGDSNNIDILSSESMQNISNSKIKAGNLLHIILQNRLLILFVIFIFGLTRAGKTIANVFLMWNGLCFGMLMTSFMKIKGIKGLLFFISMYLPQGLFYIPAIYLTYLQIGKIAEACFMTRRNIKKEQADYYLKYLLGFVPVVLLVLLGVVCETYINSYFVKNIVKIM